MPILYFNWATSVKHSVQAEKRKILQLKESSQMKPGNEIGKKLVTIQRGF